jgi:hypothetical protein
MENPDVRAMKKVIMKKLIMEFHGETLRKNP